MTRVLILGAAGYIGWPLSLYLKRRGHEVFTLDNGNKAFWRDDLGIAPLAFRTSTNPLSNNSSQDVTDKGIYYVFDRYAPEAVVHLAEQPSAPLSMLNYHWTHETVANNVMGTLSVMHATAHYAARTGIMPHIVKLGTMGEYGTPNIPIEEGWLDVTHKGHTDRVLFPKKPGSFYHASKVADSTNLEFGCRAWGLRVTDLNQGVVWGMETEDTPWDSDALRTEFHYDEIFGTVINRFAAQAAAYHPLTIYGSGLQIRGFIHLQDSLRCIELAINNPAAEGEFRVFNQLSELLSIGGIAQIFTDGMGTEMRHIPDPRVEDQRHLYEVAYSALPELGFTNPRLFTEDEAVDMVMTIGETPGLEDHYEAITTPPVVLWCQRAWGQK